MVGVSALLTALAGCTTGGASAGPRTMADYEAAYRTFPLQRFYAEQTRRQEEQIAACMSAQGFAYEIPDPDDAVGGPTLDPEMTDAEFRARYGYGVAPAPGDVAAPGSASRIDRNVPEGAAQKTAYYEAMYGKRVEGEVYMWDERSDPGPDAGCRQQAQWAVYQRWDPELLSYLGLMGEYSNAVSEIQESADLAGARNSWSQCMADAGYPDIAGPVNAYEYVYKRTETILDDGHGSAGTLSTPSPEAVRRAHALEMAVVAADDACRASTGWEEALAAVQDPYDAGFAETHRAELEAMVAYFSRPQATW